ncbi:MAG: hypothetical protein DRP58_05230 [Spirochaetes bacterium]|nr:MAG: hypothetical protein DRP58_05230 [Spirochaetota bacterium]
MIKDKMKIKKNLTLENFLSSEPGSLEYITYRSELKQHLKDPGILERSDRTSEQLRKEARTVMDAFEAVTNGMYNPVVFASLELLPEDSILSLWKELIFAIHAFYDKNYSEMENRLNKIDNKASLSVFKTLLLQLSGKSQAKSPNNKQKLFIDNIIKDRSFIRSVISEIIESLEYDMEELFLETANLMLQDLNRNYKEPAYKFAIWSIETASKYKYSPTELVTTCKKLFGNTLAYRLTAIALETEEPDISLLFWMQSLISRLKSRDLTLDETGAYFTVMSRIAGEIQTSQDKFYLESLNGLIDNMKYELKNKFPKVSCNTEKYNNPFDILISLSTNYSSLEENRNRLAALETENTSNNPATSNKDLTNISVEISKISSNKPIQLSLFD